MKTWLAYLESFINRPSLKHRFYGEAFIFTSAQQDGTNFDPVFNNLSGMIGLTNKYSQQPQITGSSHSYFLNNLFTDVIFSEANLASEDKSLVC